MIKILFIILFIILIGVILKTNTSNETNICNQQLSDNEYINHMIKHHEVAVNMSEAHLHNTKTPIMFDILRNLIRLQTYEINLMKDLKIVDTINNDLSDDMSNKNVKMNNLYRYTQGEFAKPNTPYISNTFCDPGFFNMSHNENLHRMTDMI